jgi:HlyD family secretion protein
VESVVRRTLVRIILFLAVATVIVLLVVRYMRPDPIQVAVHSVERGRVEATVANTRAGTVKACRRAMLAPQSGGQVSNLPIQEGDRVEKGSLMLELWNVDLRAQLSLAESEALAAAARAEQACLAADLAARDARRAVSLFAENVLDEQARDRAEAERDTTRAACEAARATAEEAKSRVAVARAALERTVLRAPFDGVVAELNAELGEVVIPSPPGIPTPPAVDLIEEGCLYVLAPIDEMDAQRVLAGLPARVSLDAFPGRSFAGTVRRVAPYVLDREKQARTLDVEVEIEEAGSIQNLLPGYSADVEILLERRDDVLRVPAEAVTGEGRVLRLRDGHLEELEIETGISNWRFVEVLSGLREGDRIVLSLDRPGVADGAAATPEDESVP